jgi:hypothetical protein
MRSLQRNWRELHYAVLLGTESIVDEYGNDTLEVKPIYGSPTLLRVNISANAGQEAVNVFGSQTGYSRTVSYVGDSCPLDENSVVWFGADPSGPHNYVVVKVADSKNGYLIALREVSDRA